MVNMIYFGISYADTTKHIQDYKNFIKKDKNGRIVKVYVYLCRLVVNRDHEFNKNSTADFRASHAGTGEAPDAGRAAAA